jgi:hypothetical protein
MARPLTISGRQSAEQPLPMASPGTAEARLGGGSGHPVDTAIEAPPMRSTNDGENFLSQL